MPGSFIVSPGDGRVITDLPSCGKTNWRDLPSGIVIVYFDVSSLVMVGPSVSLMRRSHFTFLLPSYPGSGSRMGWPCPGRTRSPFWIRRQHEREMASAHQA